MKYEIQLSINRDPFSIGELFQKDGFTFEKKDDDYYISGDTTDVLDDSALIKDYVEKRILAVVGLYAINHKKRLFA